MEAQKKENKSIFYYGIGIIALIFSFIIIYYLKDYKNERGEGKLNLENSDYYIGQFNNGKPNGKGKVYNSSNHLIYEGDFINGVYEGIGKLSVKNDLYYYGYFRKGKYNGKGILYMKSKNTDNFISIKDSEENFFYFQDENEMIQDFNNNKMKNIKQIFNKYLEKNEEYKKFNIFFNMHGRFY